MFGEDLYQRGCATQRTLWHWGDQLCARPGQVSLLCMRMISMATEQTLARACASPCFPERPCLDMQCQVLIIAKAG